MDEFNNLLSDCKQKFRRQYTKEIFRLRFGMRIRGIRASLERINDSLAATPQSFIKKVIRDRLEMLESNIVQEQRKNITLMTDTFVLEAIQKFLDMESNNEEIEAQKKQLRSKFMEELKEMCSSWVSGNAERAMDSFLDELRESKIIFDSGWDGDDEGCGDEYFSADED